MVVVMPICNFISIYNCFANNDSVITGTTSTNQSQSQSQSNSDTQQTTLSQQMTSSFVGLHMLTTFDGSGSVIQHSTWLCGLITLLSYLFKDDTIIVAF